jgi:predicted GNAT family N-acyltransferase
VGFPFPPVTESQVRPAVDTMVGALGPALDHLLVAEVDGQLAGWLLLVRDPDRLVSHWARVLRVQTSLDHRGTGVGRALMVEVARAARQDLRLVHLRLELRAGMGLEDFYAGLGWKVAGRWPDALRLADDDLRDEVLMVLPLG